MGDENPICTLGDYSKPIHEGYRNTIELLEGNNVVPLRSDTIRLVENGCSFHGLRSEDPNQHLKDFLKLVDLLVLNVANRERTRSNIKGISPSFCTHKILMEDDFKPVIQPQRHLNPKFQDVVKNEIVKLLDSGLINPSQTVHGLALFMLS
ncbi:hypothetical protein Tco_1561609 [Tanacetum coccineum]